MSALTVVDSDCFLALGLVSALIYHEASAELVVNFNETSVRVLFDISIGGRSCEVLDRNLLTLTGILHIDP